LLDFASYRFGNVSKAIITLVILSTIKLI